jgi:hypothetical protein
MMEIEIGKKYKVSGAVLKKLLREANIETLRQIELADISLVKKSSDIHHVIHCDLCTEESKTGNKVNKICTQCMKEHYV